MKTHQSFLLVSADAIKCIDATEALSYLNILSSISWAAKRYRDLNNRTQERMTSLYGIDPLTGDTICVKVHPILDSFTYADGEQALAAVKKAVRENPSYRLSSKRLENGLRCFEITDEDGKAVERHIYEK